MSDPLAGTARPPGAGWLALLGGGEFTFGETEGADRAWLAKAPPGPLGFIPAASGSTDYGRHLETYFRDVFERRLEVIPIYRERDARRKKNCRRIGEVAGVYLGGGVTDHLLEALADSPAHEALLGKLREGGAVVAIAAAAQCLGQLARSIFRGEPVPALGWLRQTVVEPNFEPAHDRRLREMMAQPGVRRGLGLPAGSALLLGPDGEVEGVGTIFVLDDPDGDLQVVQPSGSDDGNDE